MPFQVFPHFPRQTFLTLFSSTPIFLLSSGIFILAFDLEEEVFREILQPELPFYNRQIAIGLRLRASVSVLVYGNSIALFHYVYQRGHFHIWVMKEYGVELSWTKVFSFGKTNATETIPRPIGFRRNREIVF